MALLLLKPLRRNLISRFLFGLMKKMLPRIGDTERVALEAGTVWWDQDLFSGNPDWKKLLNFSSKKLSAEEIAFLNGPVEDLCRLLDDWKITQAGDLPPEVWAFLKQHLFFGMIIPKKFGGLEFSAIAHSAVITKVGSRSIAAAVTLMVPNSLGPAELLLHYGTEDQKKHYLPRLAKGEEIPCFALTGPEAGSDAAAIQSTGIISRGVFEGKEVLGIRLNWKKRYITLGPVATVVGLAFQLHDPEKLLGNNSDLGITCALIPASLPGVEIGDRHDSLGIAIQNGPNQGKDVFVPLEFIIGGREMAGRGWEMLMQSLAAGRSISLPSLSVATAQVAARVASAYALVRKQFGTPIGRFEGIEEPLAKIGGLTYLMNAARVLTAGAVDAGEKPSVVSAIVKAYVTELMRQVVSSSMDIQAGAAICRGPRNTLARAHSASPISITVEGANILTRSLIIFGQGAMRCHPFLREEVTAIETSDLKRFDSAFFGHVGHGITTFFRTIGLALTDGKFIRHGNNKEIAAYYGRISRLSSAFALVSEATLAIVGGELKRREKLSGRLADVLAWMYLASSTLKRFYDEGEKVDDVPLARWACDEALFKAEEALDSLLENFPNRIVAAALQIVVFPLGKSRRRPSDALGAKVSHLMLESPGVRKQITGDMFIPDDNELGLGQLEAAFKKAQQAIPIEAKLRQALRGKKLAPLPEDTLWNRAVSQGVISENELKTLQETEALREEAIQVDAFPDRR